MSKSIIKAKTYEFALRIVKLYVFLQKQKEFAISPQIVCSGTSIGANVEEALAGQSKKDFIAKMSIASKEARETNYWLRLLRDSKLVPEERIRTLIDESEEIISILTSIVKTSMKNVQLKTNNSKLKTQERGAILVISLLVMVALLLLGSALIVMTQSNYISAGVERDEKRAFYVASAGIERAIYELNKDSDWGDETPASNLYAGESLNYEAGDVTYTGSYTVVLTGMSKDDVRIISTGEVNNSERKIGIRVTR